MTARKFAHEVNNPLGIINNYLTSLKLKVADENDIDQELGIISEEIGRISLMIRQLDIFGESSAPVIELTDINLVITDIVQLVTSSLPAESHISLSFAPDLSLPAVWTSADGIKQIVINLLKNAIEALDGDGSVMLKTFLAEAAEQGVGRRVVIEVADDGPGLPEVVRKDLYKPFISTKRGPHSGLGLSIVQKTVNQLGGTISCSSKPDRGTTFSISVPDKHD